ncbi:MAG: tryptophan synthase subunit alpha [Opitutales bacterium]
MNRIAAAFAEARAQDRALLVSYVCAGDPDLETSYRVCRELLEAGVGVLELGVPFSDPLADGLTNQLAAERALKAGMTQDQVFTLVRRLREFSEVPIVLYTYCNLVMARGVETYVEAAHAAGVDGILTLDLPPEEADELLEACAKHDLKTVFIVAPTTPEARLERITRGATGFLYYVSQEGVTGVRDQLAEGIGEAVRRIRAHTDLPVVVGFGIGTGEQVRQVAAFADGVVVGSALVNRIPENLGDPEAIVAAMGVKARELMTGLA